MGVTGLSDEWDGVWELGAGCWIGMHEVSPHPCPDFAVKFLNTTITETAKYWNEGLTSSSVCIHNRALHRKVAKDAMDREENAICDLKLPQSESRVPG
jgi:hypothetical protein